MYESTRLLRELVARPSVNPMGRDLPDDLIFEHRVTDFLAGFFDELGVRYERQSIAAKRENILAFYDSPNAAKTLMFEVHQDTVPVDNMTISPFEPTVENGRLYGRGSCDVKGGMASMLTAFARVVREKPRDAANVVMACTIDEEHTCLGVNELVRRGIRADMAVVAEPTQLRIVKAHKGVMRWHVTVRGRACHSSTPDQGINAIYRTADMLRTIQLYAKRLQETNTHAMLGSATLSVGVVEGGTSVNTVPDLCRITIDRRLLPGEDPAAVYADFKDAVAIAHPDVDCEFSELLTYKPALSPEGSDQLIAELGHAIDGVIGAHEVEVVPYGTDAPTIAEAGIPTVVFGPGDIAKAHTRDESVPLDEVEQCSEILYRFLLGRS